MTAPFSGDESEALISYVRGLEAKVEQLQKEVQQCHAKSTCCCGDYMNAHTGWEGHSPVSMYSHDLYSLQQENEKLREERDNLAKEYILDHGVVALQEKYGIVVSIKE